MPRLSVDGFPCDILGRQEQRRELNYLKVNLGTYHIGYLQVVGIGVVANSLSTREPFHLQMPNPASLVPVGTIYISISL